ncbi:hypothetical protein L3Y34_001104 [Caenorhabditis briggsae]|uniref:BED-type domain-containing protein n=1 Tax=Caenorhabditis briggsae TaxID=6238 RepID=A0AAE9DB40_CAEBR|nr:hypothetical protein L3Y34_001104 [Caenorhabditis briggsae]
MTSLLGGPFSDALHTALASQLNVLSQKTSDSDGPTTFSSSSSVDSPPYDPMSLIGTAGMVEQNGAILDMFKEGLFAALVNPPPTDVAHSDTASSESPEPVAPSGEHEENQNGTEENHSAALSLIQSFGTPIGNSESDFSDATIRDLMPVLAAAQAPNGGSSPYGGSGSNGLHLAAGSNSSPSAWARNAGRKKSHPVWDFFKDLKDSTGAGGVICLHCTWSGDDRSPNNLRTHLKKFHSDDGIFNRFSEKLAKTPTQPYVKRVRGGGNTSTGSVPHGLPSMVKMEQKPIIDSMAFFQQLQQTGTLSDADFSSFANGSSLNFLDSLPKSSEVININSGFVKKEELEDDTENHVEAASSSSTDEPVKSESPDTYGSPNTSTNEDNQLADFVRSLSNTNPVMFAMLNAAGAGNSTPPQSFPSVSTQSSKPPTTASTATSVTVNTATRSASPTTTHDTSNGSLSPSKLEKDPSSFSLSEGHCAAQLMSMALDLEMTMSYHKRRLDIELCFESNKTVDGKQGVRKVICLTDLGKEIRITERINGAVKDTELWVKTDFNQFHWAIRGKCQKCFNKASQP